MDDFEGVRVVGGRTIFYVFNENAKKNSKTNMIDQ
jgi:hypothetical protein